MAEISEKQARAICTALGIPADAPALDQTPSPSQLFGNIGYHTTVEVAWRIVQRAAAEAEDKP